MSSNTLTSDNKKQALIYPRVNSKQGAQFRIWANKVLKEYLLKGYALKVVSPKLMIMHWLLLHCSWHRVDPVKKKLWLLQQVDSTVYDRTA